MAILAIVIGVALIIAAIICDQVYYTDYMHIVLAIVGLTLTLVCILILISSNCENSELIAKLETEYDNLILEIDNKEVIDEDLLNRVNNYNNSVKKGIREANSFLYAGLGSANFLDLSVINLRNYDKPIQYENEIRLDTEQVIDKVEKLNPVE